MIQPIKFKLSAIKKPLSENDDASISLSPFKPPSVYLTGRQEAALHILSTWTLDLELFIEQLSILREVTPVQVTGKITEEYWSNLVDTYGKWGAELWVKDFIAHVKEIHESEI